MSSMALEMESAEEELVFRLSWLNFRSFLLMRDRSRMLAGPFILTVYTGDFLILLATELIDCF